jgi:hypothetical protein
MKRAHERALLALQRARNDRTDAEYAHLFAGRMGLRVSRRTINRAWRRLGITRKKKVLHASEQDRPDVQRARRAFRRRARRAQSRRFIDLDEFGTNLGMTRRYGRARRGQRAVGKAPVNVGPNVTLTMGLSREGIVAPLVFEGGTNGARFEAYVREQLAPHLRRGVSTRSGPSSATAPASPASLRDRHRPRPRCPLAPPRLALRATSPACPSSSSSAAARAAGRP